MFFYRANGILDPIETYHIHITGIVQGVGFRPLVFQLAQKMNKTGWVNNAGDGVHIVLNGSEQEAEEFCSSILQNSPPLAKILSSRIEKVAEKYYSSFNIIESDVQELPNLPLTPDFALCDNCRQEIKNSKNRRYGYAFTTCTNCGPRYSIIRNLPYDRESTTMEPFTQCEDCSEEYNNPQNRRHFSQTNSCGSCGITLFNYHDETTVEAIAEALVAGKIIALKGIGGFMLMADATNVKTVQQLRKRKHRPSKPFAVMYPSLRKLEKEYVIGEVEKTLFNNEISPIILLQPRRTNLSIASDAIAPGLNRVGCMIPYAPLFELVLDRFSKPVVATSGNISGSPIIYENEAAQQELANIADLVIANNRPIVIPQDDSVFSFTSTHTQPIILRRSRGLAPTLVGTHIDFKGKSILALGAQMKSSFAITHNDYVYVSQYLGEMDNYLSQDYYAKTLEHLRSVLEFEEEIILGDQHPGYYTTELGVAISEQKGLNFYQVQHHKAHFYAVLAENDQLDTNEKILGVIWDGTGFGDDGQIWGGEFFSYDGSSMKRVAQLPYFPMILGDKMPREPRISALAVGSQYSEPIPGLKEMFTKNEWAVYPPMLAKPALRTSSMGRLFDAVACIVLGIDKISYEGEAAMMLESVARASIADVTPYPVSLKNLIPELLTGILTDKNKGVSKSKIAARFHLSLVDLIRQIAEQQKVDKLAFSGGVFQNNLLVDLILTQLGTEYKLFFHKQLSPNDECVSFGQLACYVKHELNA